MRQLNPIQEAIVENGVRWCTNILNEIAGNYGRLMTPRRAEALRYALEALHEINGPDTQPMPKRKA